MVLCKIMSNNEDEVSNILSAKLSIKFSGVEIEAMKVILFKVVFLIPEVSDHVTGS